MIFNPFVRAGEVLGFEVEFGKICFFFGSAALKRQQLGEAFPPYQFCFLKQVHGHQVVHGELHEVAEADGHFTGQINRALVIQTADCVPLMLANHSQVCALHAGWRGAAGGIVGTSRSFFIEPPEVAVIGPHIQSVSFEIGRDLLPQLLASAPQNPSVENLVHNHNDPAKCYFNLSGLLELQLLHHFPEIQILKNGENTFTSPAFHSYRRDLGGAGRQYSFVVLKP